MTITHEMNTEAFRHYLDRADIPCKEEVWSLWTEIVSRCQPSVPEMQCGPNEDGGVEISLNTIGRYLQLDLWPDGGEVFWLDRQTLERGGDEERRTDWRQAFLSRISWLLLEAS